MRAAWKTASSLLATMGTLALVAAVSIGSGAFPRPERAEAAVLDKSDIAVATYVASEPATPAADAKVTSPTPDATPVVSPPAVAQPPAAAPVAPAGAPKPKPKYRGAWRTARVSWYGPRFYGHTMAGGGNLSPKSMVVASRTMKFGTLIQFQYKGRTVVAVVNDRGPYVRGRLFDLGPGTAKKLGFSGVGKVKWRVVGHQKGPLRPNQR